MSPRYLMTGPAALAVSAVADPVEDTLVINGETEITTVAPAPRTT